MKKLLIYTVLSGIIILSNSCSSSVKGRFSSDVGIKYDTVYALPEIGTTGNYTFTTQTNDIIIDVKDNKSTVDGQIELSGTDGTNYFHEGKAIEIEEFLQLMFIIISDKNYVIRGEHPSEKINIYVETQYENKKAPDSLTIHQEILDQLSVLFDFKITEEVLPNTIYTFSLKDQDKAESFYVELPSKYKAYDGYSDFNVNEKENEFYCTFPQFLVNRKVKGNFQYIDNTGLKGVFAVPYNDDEVSDMNKFMARCKLWGIDISESIEERSTIVLTFNL